MISILRSLQNRIEHFFFGACSPAIVPPLRVAFGALMIINTLVWLRDANYWFTDTGVLTAHMAQHLNYHARPSILFWLPSTSWVVHAGLYLLLAHSVLLLLGVWSRLQMLGIFIWLVSFQHRNPLISDGEDTLFRWFAFLMIFLPLDCGWSLWRSYRQKVGVTVREYTPADAWALRLMQVQMSVIYASAAYNKLLGETWRDGTALYFVSHMNDHFGRLPLSTMLFDSLWLVRAQTWSVLAIEGLLPVALWIPRLRPWAIAVGITLHLGIELTMHLFLFEWIMILGLATFIQPQRSKLDQH